MTIITPIAIVLFSALVVFSVAILCFKFAAWLSKSDEIEIIVITGTSGFDGEYKKVKGGKK